MTALRVEYVVECLSQLAAKPPRAAPTPASDESRLKVAKKARAELHATLDRGEQPRGARPDWIRNSANKLLGALAEIQESFNVQHPEDIATVDDILDVVATLRAHLVED